MPMIRETQSGQMALLDSKQMGEADRLTTAAGTPETELMYNAGRAVMGELTHRWPPRPTTVLCGPGNNGGDGFAAAWMLAEAGWPVRLAFHGRRDTQPPAARYHGERWRGATEPMSPAVLDGAGLVIDAVFGPGFTGELPGPVAETLDAAARGDAPVVAVDMPTGLNGDSGDFAGGARAEMTVTYYRKRPGHVLWPGRSRCGLVVVVDIGMASSLLAKLAPTTFENDPRLWGDHLPSPAAGGNKHARGHALLAGGFPRTGAARMAARAAARMGAGLTTVAVPAVALPIYATSLLSVMVASLAAPADFDQLIEDHRYSACLLGPGEGVGPETRRRVLATLQTGRPTVLDADALTAFQEDAHALDRASAGPWVLTPHDGEFHRLFDPAGDKLARTRAAARRTGAVVVSKGVDTVIASPDGRAFVNTNAPASLATAGSGDVLSGMVVGLLAQGMDAFLAAAAAVWIHGAAAADFGPGLLAEDLPELLPAVLRRLGTARSREEVSCTPWS